MNLTMLSGALVLSAAATIGGMLTTARPPAPALADATIRTLPMSMCFAPNTPIEYVAAVQQNLSDRLGETLEFNLTSRWPGAVGTPVTLTYSFVPDGSPTENGTSVLFANMGAGAFGGDANNNGKPDWQDLFRQMFDRWTEVTGNTYIETNDDGAFWPTSEGAAGVRGDIRIAMAPIDGNNGLWAFNYFPGQVQAGDMLLDSVDVPNFGTPPNNFRLFRNLIGHEQGHGQGLRHVCPDATQTGGFTKLMEPFIVSAFDGPQLDDLLGAQSLYGDFFEPNNSLAQSVSLESQGLASNVLMLIREQSLHGFNDTDLFSFNAQLNTVVNLAAVSPIGTTYLEGAQVGGVCDPGVPFDALNRTDLMIELLDPSGNVVTSANAGGLGAVEQFQNQTITTTGVNYIRVRAGGTALGTQEYRLALNISFGALPGDLNGDGAVNGVDLSIVLNQFGGPGSADLNNDGVVDGADLAFVLNSWTG